MDVQSRGILISVAGFLFALFGFVLSVLGAIIDQFVRHELIMKLTRRKVVHLPSKLRGRRLGTRKPLSRHPHGILQHHSRTNVQEFSPKSESDVNINNVINPSQPPLPTITIHQPDHIAGNPFISQEQSSLNSAPAGIYPHSRPGRSSSITFVDPPNVIHRPDGRTGLPHLGTKLRPTLSRCSSSPQLTTPPASPASYPAKERPRIIIPDSQPTTTSPKLEIKIKTLRLLRKVPSAPGPDFPTTEKLEMTRKAFTGLTRNAEKARSQTLRTQPYEAPYFCAKPESIGEVRGRQMMPPTEQRPLSSRSSSTPKKVKL